MRLVPILALWPLLPVLGACAGLGELDLGVCGNNVLDPGEDCDGYDGGPETHCNAPRQPAECHFSCASNDEGQDYRCPEGMGCGKDSICREASGTFEVPESIATRPGRWMHMGDFDGDGRMDLANLRGPSLDVHYFGATGSVEESYQAFAVLPESSRPLAGDLSGDGLHDLVLPGTYELSVLVANSTRTFRPKTYLAIDVPPDARAVVVDIIPDMLSGATGSTAGSEALLLAEVDGSDVFLDTRHPSWSTVVGTAPGPASQLAGAPAVAQFVEDDPATPAVIESPTEEFALAYEGDSSVYVYLPSYVIDAEEQTNGVTLVVGDPVHVELEAGESGGIRSVTAAQLNTADPSFPDEHMDLLIATDMGEVFAAFGTGQGDFHSQPNLPPPGSEDRTAVRLSAFDDCIVLAAAELDGDGQVDLVLPDGIWLSSGGGDCSNPSVPRSGGQPWTTALVDDLNGNQWLDVVAASRNGGGIDFFNGTGTTTFSHVDVNTTGKIGELAAGDFDGDLTTDLVFTQLGIDSDGRDGLMVAFGQPGGLLEPPQTVGSLFAINGLHPYDSVSTGETLVDAASELLVLADKTADPSDGRGLAALAGRADRLLQTPFVMIFRGPDGSPTQYYAPAAASFGQFWSAGDQPAPGILAYGANMAGSPDPPTSFVGIRSTGDVELFIGHEPADPMLGTVAELRGTIVGADVDGDGIDEPISLTWLATGPERRRVTVSVLGFDAQSWLPAGAVVLPDITLVGFESDSAAHLGDLPTPFLMEWLPDMHGEPQGCRLNTPAEEGGVDLLVSAVQWQGDQPSEPVVVVLWSHILQAAANGQADEFNPGGARADEIGVIRPPAGEWIVGSTCLNTDGDPFAEVMLATLAPSDDEANAAPELRLYALDLPNAGPIDAPATLRLVTRFDEGSLEGLHPSKDLPPVSALVAGDTNGDGIDDLVMGAGNIIARLLGREAGP